MDHFQLDESAAERTQRFIQHYFWNALTRRIDAQGLDQVIRDSKVAAGHDYLYVPADDPAAWKYFHALAASRAGRRRTPSLKVVALPPAGRITGDFVRSLDGAHGLLSLKLTRRRPDGQIRGEPYLVPGGRFNELYYWDCYFVIQGLLRSGRPELARGVADNLVYLVRHYGRVPNANRTYYLTRSQPPFLTRIIHAVWTASRPPRSWLAAALQAALREYREVWLGPDRLVRVNGHELSRYYDDGDGPCPEVEPGHYDEKIQPWLRLAQARQRGRPLTPHQFLNQYLFCEQHARLRVGGLTLRDFFKHDRALRESGHDTTHRFDDRTTDFVTVDLNALLYQYEMDFAGLIEREFGGALPALGRPWQAAAHWRRQAARRKAAMQQLLWDDRQGAFFDYDTARDRRSTYISATGLYPLWARLLDAAVPGELDQARRAARFACEHLEQRAGLTASARQSVAAARRTDARQWDYPYGWAPHQMLAWPALAHYGLAGDAGRLAYRWLHTIAKNASESEGAIPEKFNAVTGSQEVFVEYGNVGAHRRQVATEGFGWMNASFLTGLDYLSPAQLKDLHRLKRVPAR